jgi:four helix bundle protein
MTENTSFADRSRQYALRVMRLYASLPRNTLAQTVGRQLLRSGMSVGAHLREARRSRSDAELISKTEGALQELDESAYWMELLGEYGIVRKGRLDGLLKEADELSAVLVAGVRRVKSRKPYKAG